MIPPPTPINEAQRLRALASSALLYTPGEARFDRITRLACSAFDVPIALVSLVAERVQWFKSAQGLTVPQTPRDVSFCGHAIVDNGPLVVEDASADERFHDNPLVTGDPHIRFYAGHPIYVRNQPIGTLCVIDTRPRSFDAEQRRQLADLAAWVENEVQMQLLSEPQRSLIDRLDDRDRQALIDPTTRAWNREAAQRLLADQLARAGHAARPLALAAIRIEACSAIGRESRPLDTLALAQLSQRLRDSARAADALLRWSDDVFLLLLADAEASAAFDVAQRIEQQVAMMSLSSAAGALEATAWIGVVDSRPPHPSAAGLIEAALSQMSAAARDHCGVVLRELRPAPAPVPLPAA